MKAEFLKDDNGNIWFFYASNIQTRSRIKSSPENGMNIESMKNSKTNEIENKEELLAEIEEYEQEENA